MSEPKLASHKAASLIEETQRAVTTMQRNAVMLAAQMDGVDLRTMVYDLNTASWTPIPAKGET